MYIYVYIYIYIETILANTQSYGDLATIKRDKLNISVNKGQTNTAWRLFTNSNFIKQNLDMFLKIPCQRDDILEAILGNARVEELVSLSLLLVLMILMLLSTLILILYNIDGDYDSDS